MLVLRPDRLGDFILSTPAMRSLQKRLGHSARLTLVAGERNAEAARFFFPDAKVLVFHKDPLRRLWLFLRLWLGRYDATLDLHSYPFSTTSAFMALLSGSPLRTGFWDGGEAMEFSRKVFNLGLPAPKEGLHESEKSMLLAKRLAPGLRPGKGRVFELPDPTPGIARSVDSFFRQAGGGKAVFLGLHPTLQKADNRWAPSNYAELIRRLVLIPDLRIILIHGRGEERDMRRFQEGLGHLPGVFALPENDFLFILEALKRCRLFLGGDSGLTHLAALATRVLAVFGPSDPRRWGPLDTGKGRTKIFRERDHRCDSVRPSKLAREIQKALKLP